LLGTDTDDLNPFSLLNASLLQPLFRGGELRARQRAAVAAFEQAGAVYRQVVLQGFREVADTLRAIEAAAAILREQSAAAGDAEAVYDMTQLSYQAGAVSTLDLLNAEQRYVRAAIAQSEAVADRFADTAALFQALGGGWWNEE
jgi:outer membrane protein TolC